VKAITIRQPWASLIAAGIKDVENRPRNWPHRGRVAIHSGQDDDRAALKDPKVTGPLITRHLSTPHGCVLAVASLVDCHPSTEGCCISRWAQPDARFHLILADVARLPRPITAMGHLGLWQLPTAAWVEIGRQLREIGAKP
jgi:hypothetical protein